MKAINTAEDAELRRTAENRYPYLARYGWDMRMHLACCLCYPQPSSNAERNVPPVAWGRQLADRREAV